MTRWLRLSVLAILGLAGVVAAGCGKKAPPLAPLIIRPAAADDVQVVRVADTVYIAFKVPARNSDGKSPAALSRVEVYGLTGEAADVNGQGLNAQALLREATKVESVEVEPPPVADDKATAKTTAETPGAPVAPPPPPPPPDDPRPAQGEVAMVTEAVTPAALTRYVAPGKPKRKPLVRVPHPWDDWPLPLAPVVEDRLARIYVVVGRDLKGRPGALSARVSVPLDQTPPTPEAPTLRHTETAIVATWVVPATARRPVFEPVPVVTPGVVTPGAAVPVAATPVGAEPVAAVPVGVTPAGVTPAGVMPADAATATPVVLGTVEVMPRPLFSGLAPHTFNLYRVAGPHGPAAAAIGPSAASVPAATPAVALSPVVPVNPAPLSTTTFDDAAMTFGVERCYVVRAVEARPNGRVEGASSPVACITPVDTFPPKAPRSLAAVGSEGAVNLIWEPNTEGDFGGYIVLRGPAGGGALAALTQGPIKETTYRDTNVTRGQRYVYAVVAVDTATPQNVSVESNRVEETAR